jgi:hypothetical protein
MKSDVQTGSKSNMELRGNSMRARMGKAWYPA